MDGLSPVSEDHWFPLLLTPTLDKELQAAQ